MVDVSDNLYFFRLGGGEGVVRGARKGARVGFFTKNPGGGGVFQERGGGGLRACRVSVGNWGGGGNFFFFFGAEIPTKKVECTKMARISAVAAAILPLPRKIAQFFWFDFLAIKRDKTDCGISCNT